MDKKTKNHPSSDTDLRTKRRDEVTAEHFEDAESNAVWVEGVSVPETDSFIRNNLSESQSDLYLKNLMLRDRLKNADKCSQQLQADNERLNAL